MTQSSPTRPPSQLSFCAAPIFPSAGERAARRRACASRAISRRSPNRVELCIFALRSLQNPPSSPPCHGAPGAVPEVHIGHFGAHREPRAGLTKDLKCRRFLRKFVAQLKVGV